MERKNLMLQEKNIQAPGCCDCMCGKILMVGLYSYSAERQFFQLGQAGKVKVGIKVKTSYLAST